jgi:NADPH:quinone reductase-like Zn-dependent oxidoreductase
MRAVRYHSTGPTFDLRLEDVAAPTPAAGEVVVRVRAASLNPVDWKIAAGKFSLLVKGGLPRTMGSDLAGDVAAVGPGVAGVREGDPVWGFDDPFRQPQGTFAEFCAVPAGNVFPRPADVSCRDAAALACVGVTAVTMCALAEVTQGKRVLVNGASGGVGHVAVQVAKARGARVTAVASARRRGFVTSLGADEFIDYGQSSPGSWPGGFDAVLDCVPNLPRSIHRRLLARGGHYVSSLPGAATFLLDPLLNRFGAIQRHGVMLAPNAAAMQELASDLARGRLRCHIEDEFTLDQVAAAIARSRAGRVQGKLVIRVE